MLDSIWLAEYTVASRWDQTKQTMPLFYPYHLSLSLLLTISLSIKPLDCLKKLILKLCCKQ